MKFFHLSDLHIGKRIHEFSMLEDQRYILNEILQLADKERPDGVLLAGDIYDKAIPTAEAVQIFDGFLQGLVKRRIPVFLINGNHDSAERLAFGAGWMDQSGIYIAPLYDGTVKCVRLEDAYGTVCIHLLPFLRPALVRHVQEERAEEVVDYPSALEVALFGIKLNPEERNILIAHQFVTGASRCDSEELQVGTIDQIPLSLFDAFDYVALGHIHSPQKVGRETVRYCGSPLKYSFSEAEQQKSVTVVELEEKGRTAIRTLLLQPQHDLRKVKGTYLEVTARSFYESSNCEDYLQITLTDEEDVVDGLAKLRTIYPNLIRLEYDNRRTRENGEIAASDPVQQKTELELFQEFYEMQNNQPMSGQQHAYVRKLIQELKE